MNKSSLCLAALSLVTAFPALAGHERFREWERQRGGREYRGEMVAVDRRQVKWMLEAIDRHLNEIVDNARGRDRAMLQGIVGDLREELGDVRELVQNGPPANGAPQQVVVQQAPPPPPPNYGPPPPPPPAPPRYAPMNDMGFRGLLGTMDKEGFPAGRMRVLSQAAAANYFLVGQMQQILQRFEFPRDKLEAVRAAKDRVIDPNNFYQLYASFEFPRDKDELKRILGQ